MTKREEIMKAIISLLKATEGIDHVERSLVKAYDMDETPVVVVHRGAETINNQLIGVVNRTMDLRITVICRGDNPEVAADDLMGIVHPVLMSASLPDVMDLSEDGSDEPKYADRPTAGCFVQSHYSVLYRTAGNTL